MRNRNKKQTPEELLDAIDVRKQGAVSLFDAVAIELEAAAEEADAVLQEAETEVIRLRLARDRAFAAKSDALARAKKVRELV
jgi:hypothetical protein